MNRGAWDKHYVGLVEREPYGDQESYEAAADWVRGCTTIEDWGCGKGWLRQFCDPDAYVGVDGSKTPFADVITDLVEPRGAVEGIVLRHVLEHDYRWRDILQNAVDSFTKRLCIVLFTPLVDVTNVLQTEPDYGDVPVIAFQLTDITAHLPNWRLYQVSGSYYNTETIIQVSK
jgi:hypothetical protein